MGGPVFPEKLLLCVCVAVFGMTFVSMGLYTLGPVRYVVILAEAVLLYFFRNQLLSLLKQIKKERKS